MGRRVVDGEALLREQPFPQGDEESRGVEHRRDRGGNRRFLQARHPGQDRGTAGRGTAGRGTAAGASGAETCGECEKYSGH